MMNVEIKQVAAVAVVALAAAVMTVVADAVVRAVEVVAVAKSSARFVTSMGMTPRSVTIAIPIWAPMVRVGLGLLSPISGPDSPAISGMDHQFNKSLGMVLTGLDLMQFHLCLTGLGLPGMVQISGQAQVVLHRVNGLILLHMVGFSVTGVGLPALGMPPLKIQAQDLLLSTLLARYLVLHKLVHQETMNYRELHRHT